MPKMNASVCIGEKFGRLTIVGVEKRGARYRLLYFCDCGNAGSAQANHVRGGKIQSCGCLMRESRSYKTNKFKTHGHTNSKVYRTWQTMRKRCSRPGYKYYSEIGVKVCARWDKSFENFYADMGEPPTKDHSIDRINPFGNYEPSNCRWATRSEQQRNRRCNKR